MPTNDKMNEVTSTPRTDAEIARALQAHGKGGTIMVYKLNDMEAFARQLELDAATWRAKAKRWQEIADQRAIEVADLKVATPSAVGRCLPHDADTLRAIAARIKQDGRLQSADELHAVADRLEGAALSATRPRLTAMPIVKTLKDQRDEVADVLREVMAKLREDFDQPEDIDPHAFTMSWESLMQRAHAILGKCPSYEQQLRNVAEGLGMTYEELIESLSQRAADRGIPSG